VTGFPNLKLTLRFLQLALGYLSLTLLFPQTGRAQYYFESWDTDRGLPQNGIHSILQTHDGYLWLATLDGLVRFDGVRFTTFNVGNTKGISSNRFERLYESTDGSLWVTAADPWVIKYRDGVFQSYGTGGNTRDYVATGIWQDRGGRLIISTLKGLASLENEKFVAMTSPEANACTRTFVSAHGIAWCDDDAGVHVLKPDGSAVLYTLSQGLSSHNVSYVAEDVSGNVWIATRDSGLNRFKDGVFTHFAPQINFSTIAESRDGAIWFGTDGAGLLRFKDNLFTTYTTADGLADNKVQCLYEDREGTFWVGTVNHGLVHLTRPVITAMAQRQGLSPVNAYAILEDHNGTIWVGTWNDGVSRYEKGSFTHFSVVSRYGPLKWVSALAEDGEGRLWVGALRSFVGWYQDGKYTSLPEVPGEPGSISVLMFDHEGALWIGTDVGLKKYRDGVFTSYTNSDGLAGNDVKALHEDSHGHLWIGTYGGLTEFAGGKFRSFRQADGLASDRVRAIYEDHDGVLWIGTYDGGLSRLKDGKLTSYTVKNGLFDGGVFQILEDARGNFWMSCNHGIYRVRKQELNDFADGRTDIIHSVSYGKRDGMLNVECNGGSQPAGLKSRDGRLWFPTQEGLAVINPDEVQSNPLPPPIVIESGELDQASIDVRQGVRIEPGQESLEIHYTALSFINSEQISFSYKMEGLDKDWVEAGSRRVAYYAHLPPGQYTFVVRAANADGVWNTAGRSLLITVVPPFWRRWWFVTLAVCVVAGGIFLVYEGRISQLRRARAAQEAFSRQLIESQENERKRIAAELHDSIGQSLLIIKNRALFGRIKSDGNGGADEFDEITVSATQAINEVREIAYNLRPYLLDRIGLTKTLEAMIEKIGAAADLRVTTKIAPIDGLLSKDGEISLYRIVQEGINNIVKHAGADTATIEIQTDRGAILVSIADNGQGFDTHAIAEHGQRGFGLTGMSERVRMLGGSYHISSTKGQGTTITIRIARTKGKTGHDEV
jgi:signal transduction histidine kinase/ligand-binding sensor domain-containing protein